MQPAFPSTDRLDLVPFSPGDGAHYRRIWGDPEVIWWGACAGAEDCEAAYDALLERMAAMPDGMGWWWLRHRTGGEIVGDVILQPAPEPPGGTEIGWHLARAHWGHGYATEGARPLLPHAWDLGVDEVIATIVPVNLPSVGVAERLGMTRRSGTVPRMGLAHGVWAIARPGSPSDRSDGTLRS